MDAYELSGMLFGHKRAESDASERLRDLTISGVAESDSADGLVSISLDGDLTQAEDDGLEHDHTILIPTEVGVYAGDEVAVTLTGADLSTLRVTGVVGDGDRVNARISGIEADYVKATELEADVADIGFLKADSAVITDIQADTAKVHNLTAQEISAATGYVADLQAGSVSAQDIVAGKATVGQLAADHVSVSDLDAATARIGDLEADHVSVSDFTAEQANIDSLQAATADIATIRANSAKVQNLTAAQLEADHATIGTLDTTYMHANMSNSDVAWIENGTIKDGAIVSAMINDVSANKLTAGTINGSVINVTNLNADNITTGTINGQRIGEGSLSLDKLSEDVYTEAEVNTIVDGLNDRIDGAIETHTGTAVPMLNNSPASSWNTTKLRDEHVGDVYYVVNSQSQQNGYCYRFTKSGSTYSWQLIKDSDVTAALSRLTTAEGKITSIESFDSTVSSFMTNTDSELTSVKSRATSLETRMTDAEEDISEKVDTSTFNTLSQTVDGNSASITSMGTVLTNNGLTSSTNITNTVNTVSQTATGNSSKISQLTTTLGTNADGTTKDGDVMHRTSAIEQDVSSFKTTVSETYATKSSVNGKADASDVTALAGRVTTAESNITQNANNIELKVSKDGVISSINQSAETVKIQASKVEIDGTAVFNNSAFQEQLTSSYSKTIEYVYNNSGQGTGYAKLANITAKAAYLNLPITFTLYRRGQSAASHVTVTFANSSPTDTLSQAYYDGWLSLYYVRVDTGSYDIYIALGESWDTVKVADFVNPYTASNMEVTWAGAYYGTSLPSGAVAFTRLIGAETKESYDNKIASAQSTANAAAPKTQAVKRTQRIWYRKSASGAPSTPGTASSNWVTKADDGDNAWTKMHIAISSSAKYIYTCEQYEMANGTVGYTSVLLDNTITVIDGGNIITGSVTANKLNASDINASKSLTVGAMTDAAAATILNSNVQVGGRNLLRSTGDFAGWLTSGNYAGSATEGIWTFPAPSSLNWSNVGSPIPNLALSDYDGETLTLSFDYRSDDFSDTSGSHCVFVNVNGYASAYTGTRTKYRQISTTTFNGVFVPTTEWHRGSITFTMSESLLMSGSGAVTHFGIVFYNYTLNSYQLRHVKLEKGNKATDWTPAPEDVDAAITDAAKTATSYVTDITGGGIMVHPSGNQNTGVRVTSDVDILRSGTSVANYGATARIGTLAGKHVSIDSDSVDLMDGAADLATFGANETHLGLAGAGKVYMADDKFLLSAETTEGETVEVVSGLHAQNIGTNYHVYSGIESTLVYDDDGQQTTSTTVIEAKVDNGDGTALDWANIRIFVDPVNKTQIALTCEEIGLSAYDVWYQDPYNSTAAALQLGKPVQRSASSNVSITSTNTWIDGPTVSLDAGYWMVVGVACFNTGSSSGSRKLRAQLRLGSSVYAEGTEVRVATNEYGRIQASAVMYVSSTANATLVLSSSMNFTSATTSYITAVQLA